MLIRCVHRNKEGHYTQAPLDIRCAAVKGVQMVFLLWWNIFAYTATSWTAKREGKARGSVVD